MILRQVLIQGSHALWKTQGNGLSMENQGNLREFSKAPQGILENSKISGNSEGILSLVDLSTASEECYIVSICFALSFQISIIYRSIYIHLQYTKNHKFSFKVTCDSYFIVKLALQSENVLASLASLTSSQVFNISPTYILSQGTGFQLQFLCWSDNLMWQAFLFLWQNFSGTVLLKSGLWVGAVLRIFVTKMAKSISSLGQILCGICYQGQHLNLINNRVFWNFLAAKPLEK